jgi:hypothetical protein
MNEVGRRLCIVAIGCLVLATPAWAQTTILRAYPPPYRVPEPGDLHPISPEPSELAVIDPETAVHSAPDENFPVVDTIGFGTKVMVIDSAGAWSHVIAAGAEGYVSSDSLK